MSEIKNIANSLAEHEMSHKFVLSSILWFDLLNTVNKVIKTLQNDRILIDYYYTKCETPKTILLLS